MRTFQLFVLSGMIVMSGCAGLNSEPNSAQQAVAEISDVDVLVKLAVEDKDDRVRGAAIDRLGEIGDVAVVDPLIAALDQADRAVRLRIFVALGKIGDSRASTSLARFVFSEDPKIRKHALEALGEIDDLGDVECLDEALAELDEDLPGYTSDVFDKFAVGLGLKAIPPLVRVLGLGREDLGMCAVDTLVDIGPQVVPSLMALCSCESDDVDMHRADVISGIGLAAIAPLAKSLKDEDESVRQAAATSLSNLHQVQVLELLLGACSDESDDVKTAAKEGLEVVLKALIAQEGAVAMVLKLTQPTLLTYLAKMDLEAEACNQAVDKISASDLLADIAQNAANKKIREYAAEKLVR